MLFTPFPAKDSDGNSLFRYPRWTYRLAVACTVAVVIGLSVEPPGKPLDIVLASVFMFAVLFMTVQTARYHLILEGNVIRRRSPWYWDKRESFSIREFPQIDITYQAFHATLRTKTGDTLQVPFLLCGAFQLISTVAKASGSSMTEKVRQYIEHYAGKSRAGSNG